MVPSCTFLQLNANLLSYAPDFLSQLNGVLKFHCQLRFRVFDFLDSYFFTLRASYLNNLINYVNNFTRVWRSVVIVKWFTLFCVIMVWFSYIFVGITRVTSPARLGSTDERAKQKYKLCCSMFLFTREPRSTECSGLPWSDTEYSDKWPNNIYKFEIFVWMYISKTN